VGDPEKPKIFAALLVYESYSPAPGYEPLYEETTTLVTAENADEATRKAREHAASRETTYENADGESISLRLKHLVDVSEITEPLGDGAEIYTRHFRNYAAYQQFESLLNQTSL
jgi:hypothetical protein